MAARLSRSDVQEMFIFCGEEMCVGDLSEGESEMGAVERWGWGFFGIHVTVFIGLGKLGG